MLGAEHLDVFSEVFSSAPDESKKAAVFLSSALASEIASDSFPTNGGAVMILAFAMGYASRLDYLAVTEAVFAGGAPEGVISETSIGRLDVCGSNLSAVEFVSTQVSTLVVDSTSIVGRSLPEVSALEIRRAGHIEGVLRNQSEIRKFISDSLQLDVSPVYGGPKVRLLDKVARRAIRHFYLRPSSDQDEGSALLSDPSWPEVAAVLREQGRLDVIKGKPMHGRPTDLIRIKRPAHLLDHSLPDTQAILERLTT